MGCANVVAHDSAMWGIGWEKQPDQPIKPRFSLYRRKGTVEEDAFNTLKEITAGWFAFLADEAYLHFVQTGAT